MTVSVSSLVHYLKNKLDTDELLHNLLIEGELSNFHAHQSGHLYFTLKDDKAAISCIMFRYAASSLTFKPKSGDKVLIKADVSVFEASGQMQLYVRQMKPYGLGELFIAYEKLKQKLSDEGYFDENHKINKPAYPLKVAVLVGDKSAAMSDIKTTFKRRWPLCEVDYYPVLVQGDNASEDIISRLITVDELNYDAIILARGGGSFEDLFCFNDEMLVKTIYNLKTFIITGVGHEQDFTLVDFVADIRAATPTASVELLTPDINDLLEDLKVKEKRLNYLINIKLRNKQNNLSILINRPIFKEPYRLIEPKILQLEFFKSKLYNTSERFLRISHALKQDEKTLRMLLNSKLRLNKDHLENNNRLLKYNFDVIMKGYQNKLTLLSSLLESNSTNRILDKGYVLAFQDGKLKRSIKDIKENKELILRFKDGEVITKVMEINHGKDNI